MSWYVEFEVENEDAEFRFWNTIDDVGNAAKDLIEAQNNIEADEEYQLYKESLATLKLVIAALDLAREMKYIE